MRLLLAVVLCVSAVGCVRPQYDAYMADALDLVAETVDTQVDEYHVDLMTKRSELLETQFWQLEQKVAASQPVTQTDLEALRSNVEKDAQVRAVIQDRYRKARVATSKTRELAARSRSIAENEAKFLGSIGLNGGSK